MEERGGGEIKALQQSHVLVMAVEENCLLIGR